MSDARPVPAEAPLRGGEVVRRHRLSTRVWHWVNALVFFVMLMSGLMIFNAHPRLYWGEYGANYDPAWLQIGVEDGRGYLRVGETSFDTTGVLGTRTVDGRPREPRLPGLGDDPVGLRPRAGAALASDLRLGLRARARSPTASAAFVNGHLRRDLLPRPARAGAGAPLAGHPAARDARLPAAARRRGTTTCCRSSPISAVLVVLIPVMILTGLTMSPSMDATWPWLLDLFGGRQTARSIHFIAAWALVVFLVVHLVMVVLAGPINEIRSMITGRYRLPEEKD